VITKKTARAIKILAISSLGFATFFGLLSLMLYFGDWNRLFLVVLFGLFIGFLAAPEIEPTAFKFPELLQTGCGVIAGALLGIFLDLTGAQVIGISIAGGVLGLLAPLWIKHISAP
jgi:hypothetical protein